MVDFFKYQFLQKLKVWFLEEVIQLVVRWRYNRVHQF